MPFKSKPVITVCPYCDSKYRVSPNLLGHSVACRKCENIFILNYNSKPNLPSITEIAVKQKVASGEEISTALTNYEKLKATTDTQGTLISFLVDNDIIPPDKMKLLLLIREMCKIRFLDLQFSKIALAKGFLSEGEIEKALSVQYRIFRDRKESVLIGDLLVKSGLLSEEMRNQIMLGQNRQKPPVINASSPDMPTEEIVQEAGTDITVESGSSGMQTSNSQTQTAVSDTSETVEILMQGIELVIQHDSLSAAIRHNTSMPLTAEAPDIMERLEGKGISHGLVDEKQIGEFLSLLQAGGENMLEIARGTPALPGENSAIQYYFETEYQKIGVIDETGNMDFRNRGDIPNVKKGDRLATKTTATMGTPGVNIFGRTISPPEPEEMPLVSGTGTELSPDGMELYAATDGQPKISMGGIIFVLEELHIAGDVGYKTGHIEFDGNITIDGEIQNGFKVKGNNITAEEINGGEIEATGDVTVKNGITEAKITSQGNVSGKFINKTGINAFGSIMATKEIIDSRIETSGCCTVKTGKIISSEIIAKQGIFALNIGTDMSRPCMFKVGVKDHIDKEIDILNKNIEEKKTLIAKINAEIRSLNQKDEGIQEDIAKHAHIQDRALSEERKLKQSLPEEGETDRDRILEMIEGFGRQAKDAEKAVSDNFKFQEQLFDRISENRQRIKDTEKIIEMLSEEKKGIRRWDSETKTVPEVTAFGTLGHGTRIYGSHSSITVDRDMKRTKVKETKTSSREGKISWHMKYQQA